MRAGPVVEAWRKFWFAPAAATCLGVSRFLFFLGLFLFYLPHDFSGWGDVSPSLRQPIWLFERFGVPFLGPGALVVVQTVWKLSLFMSCIGLFSGASMFVAAAFGTYLLGLGHNFGQIYHFDAILVFAFWILAFSRAGDAWSIDALRRVAADANAAALPPSGEYRWPVQLILVALSFVFCAAGIAKLRASGLDWITSGHLAIVLDRVQYRISDADPLLPIGSFVARIPYAPHLLALGTIVFEAGYPIALFSRRLRPVIILGGIGLIVGIRVLMGPTFENFLLINLFWVPWDRVGAWLRARLPVRTDVQVLYDGACGLCRPAVAVMRRLDLLRRVAFMDVVSDWPTISHRFPDLNRERCLAEMHAVNSDGRTCAGFEAYRAIARSLPLGWFIRPLLAVPPAPQIGRRIYRRLAARRPVTCHWTPPSSADGQLRGTETSPGQMIERPDISVVIPTFNRSAQLPQLIQALLAQDAGALTYEVIIVDNNSTDATRATVAGFMPDSRGLLQYVFEPRQGVSYARNAGIARAHAPIVAFLDDDGIPEPRWVRSMKEAFDAFPAADCIGGRVRPQWVSGRPHWLTEAHAGPVALQDRPQEQWVSRFSAAMCLLTANLGVRREVFGELGGFSPAYPRNQDREFELRMWRAGKQGLYLPSMDVVVPVPPERLTKRYHRRWQATTGKYHALLRFRDAVDGRGALSDRDRATRRLFGTPLFLHRSLMLHATGWILALLRWDGDRRFYHETRVCYLVSFMWTRFKTDVLPHRGRRREAPAHHTITNPPI